MHVHAETTEGDRSQAGGNPVQRTRHLGKPATHAAHDPPEAVAQRKRQQMLNDGPRVRQLKAIQEMVNNRSAKQEPPVQRTPDATGLGDGLKSGIESLSGYSMDDVKVHYNSARPAQLNAHAYAQGTDIHVAPGQEEHLPHEAWHVVQQKQGRVRPTLQMRGGVSVNDDRGLEHEADVMGGRAMQMKPEAVPSGRGIAGASGKLVQRVERDATVTWNITHLVKAQPDDDNESLFGRDDDWMSGELNPELGQLVRGQLVKVDDEEMFMSRRGPNQDDSQRREEDREANELKYKWLRVREVFSNGEWTPVPGDTFIRAETIEFADKKKREEKPIEIGEVQDQDAVRTDLERFQTAWENAAKKRRRSTGRVVMDFEGKQTAYGDDISSGWNWDLRDEGVNVSADMQNPDSLAAEEEDQQQIFSARYATGQEQDRIAYMVLEVRNDELGKYMYIRWLIGHPEKGGGGSALVKKAINAFNEQNEIQRLRVDSAFAAVSFYKSLGFTEVEPRSVVEKDVGYADTELVYTKN